MENLNVLPPSEDSTGESGSAHGNQRQEVLLAYIAGIVDGEGCIRINKTKAEAFPKRISVCHTAILVVGMVDRPLIEFLKEATGAGTIREERVPNMRSVWRWSVNKQADLLFVLKAIRPYLRIKGPQADLAVAFIENKVLPFRRRDGISASELQRREEAYQAMRKLNAVGSAATTKCVGTREGEAIVWPCGKPQEGGSKSLPRQPALFE